MLHEFTDITTSLRAAVTTPGNSMFRTVAGEFAADTVRRTSEVIKRLDDGRFDELAHAARLPRFATQPCKSMEATSLVEGAVAPAATSLPDPAKAQARRLAWPATPQRPVAREALLRRRRESGSVAADRTRPWRSPLRDRFSVATASR